MNVRQYVLVKVQLVISDQPFPYALGTCPRLCPADCIQERITHKERSTSHFTLEEVGWFFDMAASRLPESSSLVVFAACRLIGVVTAGAWTHRVVFQL